MIFHSPVKRTRLLAILLLAAFAWGTIAEFNHHHGNRTRPGQTILSSAQDSIAAESSSPQIESDNSNGTSSTSKTGAACLICQLHQNLSATLFSQTLGVGPTEALNIRVIGPVVLQHSKFTANQHGRAPPINL
jgi:hypothetical protein